MGKYISFFNLCRLALLILIIVNIFQIHWLNLLLFWAFPLIFSSLQLFFFGTFLPHRHHQDNKFNLSCLGAIKSLHLPILLSLIACYHFSYHQEHHRYPFLAWWQLPFAMEFSQSHF